jgi:RHS repeat-associated protein
LIGVVTEDNGQVSSTVSYAYDADGNRVQTTADGQVTQYVVDNNGSLSQVVAELDQDDGLLVSYLHGDDLISQSRGGATHYYHYDGLGSTRALSDQTAVVTDSYDYEAFGELLGQTGSTENNYLYTGEQIDPNTGNYYLRARFYNPGSGRFLSMDSFEGVPQDPVTLHKYLYGNGDPVNVIDPNGLFGLMEFGIANDIRMILSEFQIEFGTNFLGLYFDPDVDVFDLSPMAVGSGILFRMLGDSKAANNFLGLFSCNGIGFSFTGETLVTTREGQVPIKDIQIGDFVLSYDEENASYQYNEVINLIRKIGQSELLEIAFNVGENITSTLNHPFYLADGTWVIAQELQKGDEIRLANGDLVTVTDLSKSQATVDVYNLTVEGTHTYTVGSQQLVVHNKKTKCKKRTDKVRKGKTLAYLAMNTLLAQTPNQRLNQKPPIRVVVGAYDFSKPKARAAFNGPAPNTVHPALTRRLQKLGVCVGDQNVFGTSNTIGHCAEFHAANKLLQGGSSLKNIDWTLAYVVKKGSSGHAKRGDIKRYCKNCQVIFDRRN